MPTPSTAPLVDPDLLPHLDLASRLLTTNPFDPAWESLLAAVLGDLYLPPGTPPPPPSAEWSEWDGTNFQRLAARLLHWLGQPLGRLMEGVAGTPEERAVYQRAALVMCWVGYGSRLQAVIDGDGVDVPFYDEFLRSHRLFLGYPGIAVPDAPHLLALLYQARRAWHFATTKILGASPSAAEARAAIWQANLGGDVCAYADGLYRRMDEIPVLVTGETGTGKDLAAQCIGWSRYIPFDAATRRFERRYTEDFHVRNLCEVPADLMESALFGHRRGSFTGANADATGCLALPGPNGTLFLDEVGEIPGHVQAKLLRPFQNREYVPLGETRPRKMEGRLVFATHEDLDAMCARGQFRADLHERMNGVHVHMPSLRQMVAEAPGELRGYVRAFVADKIDSPARVEAWTDRVVASIHATRADYPWPRNLRELKNYTERCILAGDAPAAAPVARATVGAQEAGRSEPPAMPQSTCVPSSGILGPRAKAGEVTMEELNRAYVTRVHVLTDQNKAETARRTGIHWRRVSRWIDPARLARWLGKRK